MTKPEFMCWLGVGPEGPEIRLYEPVQMRDGVVWAYVERGFADSVIEYWWPL